MSSIFNKPALELKKIARGSADTLHQKTKTLNRQGFHHSPHYRETIMRDFIITTIIALAAAKAEAKDQDKLQNQNVRKKLEFRQQLEGRREVVNYMGHLRKFK